MIKLAKINAIAPWFGSKRTLAPRIVEELGAHKMYFEPFCGSMSVLFAKERATNESVNDLHGYLTNLARVVQCDQSSEELFYILSKTFYSDALIEASRQWLRERGDVPFIGPPSKEAAYHYFICSWMGRNGVAGTERQNYQKATRWTPGGGSGPTRFISAIDSIPAWHQRLRNVDILNRDGFDILGRISDQEGVAIYCDPPYLQAGRGGAKYQHDFEDGGGGLYADDHKRLADLLCRFKHARVVVSYYDDERLCELYPNWTKLDCKMQKNLHVQNRRGSGKEDAPEVLLVNGPSYGKGEEL